MLESMKLFKSICNNKWFVHTPFIIFFNKKDLLEIKIENNPLKTFFPEYEGPNEYKTAASYIKDQFLRLDETRHKRETYTHLTCATDTENIRLVFDVVTNAIKNINMSDCALT